MPKVPLNGFIEDVGNVQFVGANNTPKQEILLRVPAWRDNFGETKGTDDFWKITIMGDKIDRWNLHSRHIGSKVKTEVFIASKQYTSKKDSSIGYMVNVSLSSIEFVSAAQPHYNQQSQQTAHGSQPDPALSSPEYLNNRAGEEDDLPF